MTDEIPIPASTVRTLVSAAVPSIEEQSGRGNVNNANSIQSAIAHAIHQDNPLNKSGEFVPVKEDKLSTLMAFAKSGGMDEVYEARRTASKFRENQHQKN